jgi:hypothetical protein
MSPVRDGTGKFISRTNNSKPASSAASSDKLDSKVPSVKLPKPKLNITTLVVLAIVVIAAIATSAYFYQQYQKSQEELEKVKSNPEEIAKQEAKALVDRVAQLVDLPSNEDPTVATVTDAKKLKKQPFFSTAKNGDKVLIYTQAKKAVLYRPATNKIIEIAPVSIGDEKTKTEPEDEPTQQP